MTEHQLLDFIDYSISELERQLKEAKRQRSELEDFLAGKRKSRYRLGSVYYLRFGQWVDDLRAAQEMWASRYADDDN